MTVSTTKTDPFLVFCVLYFVTNTFVTLHAVFSSFPFCHHGKPRYPASTQHAGPNCRLKWGMPVNGKYVPSKIYLQRFAHMPLCGLWISVAHFGGTFPTAKFAALGKT